jgi:hypothetical protein
MLSEGRQVNVDKLKVWFRTSGVASPAHYGFSMKSWELSWLAFLLRPGSNQPHIPLKHLLLETALALQAPVTEPLVEHVPKGPSGRDTARRDKEYAAAVQKVVAAYVRRGERLRVSDVLTQVGCFGSFRHAPAAFPRTAKAVAALKASTAACRPNWGKGLQADFTDPKEVNRRS